MNNHKSTEEAKNAILERIAEKLISTAKNEVAATHSSHGSHSACVKKSHMSSAARHGNLTRHASHHSLRHG